MRAVARSIETEKQTTDLDRPYQSLYRRFRPQSFAEVRGQDHVTLALRNAVRDGHTTHAYLFSGPRGTGKTSTARILAKALNCEAPNDGEPCGLCESCRAIAEGTSFDVHELDAASNNGVEAMRDLVARASLATPGRWKVYIVDEVHMLSTAASNALLKTLEEPPEHVVFVLATTDPQKVLPTLRSRTQHFEFHLIDEEELTSLVSSVVEAEKISADSVAVAAVVRRARGSARDALSVLDQIAAGGTAIDYTEAIASITAAIATSEVKDALVALDEAIRKGRDPAQLALEIIERLRADFLSIVRATPAGHNALAVDPADILAELGAPRCVRAMDLIGNAIVAMRDAPDPRVTLEVALIRAARPDSDTLPDAIVERLDRLERRLDSLGSKPSPTSSHAPPPPPPARSSRETPPVDRPTAGQTAPERPDSAKPVAPALSSVPSADSVAAQGSLSPPPSRDDLVAAWGDEILPKLRPKLRAIFQAGRFVESDGPNAVLALPNQAHIEHAEPLCGEVALALSRHFGRSVAIRLITDTVAPTKRSAGTSGETANAVNQSQVDLAEAELVAEARSDTDDPQQGPEAPVSGLALIEDRLLEAFPGAEEV